MFSRRHSPTSSLGRWLNLLTSIRILGALLSSTRFANNASSVLKSSSVILEVASFQSMLMIRVPSSHKICRYSSSYNSAGFMVPFRCSLSSFSLGNPPRLTIVHSSNSEVQCFSDWNFLCADIHQPPIRKYLIFNPLYIIIKVQVKFLNGPLIYRQVCMYLYL